MIIDEHGKERLSVEGKLLGYAPGARQPRRRRYPEGAVATGTLN